MSRTFLPMSGSKRVVQKGCASSTLSDLIEVKHVPANVLFRQYYRPHSCVASDPLEASALPLELRFGASKQHDPFLVRKKIALPLRVSSKKSDAFISDAIFISEISA